MVLDKMICSTILKQFTKKIMVIKKGNQLTMKNQVRFFFLISSFNNTFFIADSGNIVYDYDYAQGRGQQRNFNEFHDEDIFRSVPKPVITFGF